MLKRDRPREFEIVGARAQVAACSGKVIEARQLYEETVHMAEFRSLADVGTNHLACDSWMEMTYGKTEVALRTARRVLSRNPSYDPQLRAALVLSTTGCIDEAQLLADKFVKNNPEHTIINSNGN